MIAYAYLERARHGEWAHGWHYTLEDALEAALAEYNEAIGNPQES